MDGIKLTIKTEGFKELDRALSKLPERVAKRALQKSVNKALRVALKDVRAAAPAGDSDRQSPGSIKYGTLKKNIKVKKYRRTKKYQKGARLDTGNAFWAVFYELGTSKQPARPFFRPAFTRAKEKVLKTLGEELGKNIEKEAQKLRKGA